MFDDENLEEGYPCDCGGSITLCGDRWMCDACDFIKHHDPRVQYWVRSAEYGFCLCGKQFKTMDALVMHIKASHIGIGGL